MRKLQLFSAALTTALAVVAAALTYARETAGGGPFPWLRSFVSEHRAGLAAAVLVLSLVASGAQWLNAYVSSRHEHKQAIQRFVDEFVRHHFGEGARKNRVTLFKATGGWRQHWWSLWRLVRNWDAYKWRAIRRMPWRARYLGVYVRGADSRNPRSAIALRISDAPRECQGMAGRVWEEGSCLLPDLPRINVADVRAITDFAVLDATHPIRIYAEATNIRDLVVLQAMQHFARHFFGLRVRRNDGTTWGVLLLDSEDERCPLPSTLDGRSKLVKDMQALAVNLSKLIS